MKSDINGDTRVDAKDLLLLVKGWRHSSTISDSTDDLFYYSEGRKIFLDPSETSIGVAFREGVGETERLGFLADYADLEQFFSQAPIPPGLFGIALSQSMDWTNLQSLLDLLAEDERVHYVTPVFGLAGGSLEEGVMLTEAFSAKFMSGVTEDQIEAFNELHGVVIIESGNLPDRNGRFLLKPRDVKNALLVLDLANLYYESRLTEWAHPDFANAAAVVLTAVMEANRPSRETERLGIGPDIHSITSTERLTTNSGGLVNRTNDESDLFYYSENRRFNLLPSRTEFAVAFQQGVPKQDRDSILSSFGPLKESFYNDLSSIGLSRIESATPMGWDQISAHIDRLSREPQIRYVTPIFTSAEAPHEMDLVLTDSFIVKFRPDVSLDEIETLNNLNDVIVIQSGNDPYANGRFLLRPRQKIHALDVLRLANEYYEYEITEWSHPDFFTTNMILTTTPNDTLFADQWHLNNESQDPPDGTSDADMDAPEGWDIGIGNSSTIIAIIDSGVDLDHPDLDGHLWENTTEVNGDPGIDDDANGKVDDINGWDFYENDNMPDDDGDDGYGPCGHGTACAGLAAAESNNSAGVAGVSWAATIMPVRVFGPVNVIPPLGQLTCQSVTLNTIANAIAYAAAKSADVISNSWRSISNDNIIQEIRNARNSGREGKGCIVVFATGNTYFGTVEFPGRLDQVISVGATDHDDTKWGYSNFGTELDVMAPSNDGSSSTTSLGTLCTTDLQGSDGYNDGSDGEDFDNEDYTRFFGGTSGACPQVAGLASVILSQNSDLRASEVQSLIQVSADDEIGPTPAPTVTPGQDSLGWDQYYGWGRINVYNALATEVALPGSPRELEEFEVRNGSPTPTPLVKFDQFGFLYLRGNLKGTKVPAQHATPYNTPIPTPNPNKNEFYLKNSNGTPVALVDGDTGDLFIAGDVFIHQTVPTPNPSEDEFRIKDSSGTPVALINEDGDLYLKGDYYNQSNP